MSNHRLARFGAECSTCNGMVLEGDIWGMAPQQPPLQPPTAANRPPPAGALGLSWGPIEAHPRSQSEGQGCRQELVQDAWMAAVALRRAAPPGHGVFESSGLMYRSMGNTVNDPDCRCGRSNMSQGMQNFTQGPGSMEGPTFRVLYV